MSRSVKFSVTSIKYDENKDITSLVISDNKGNVRYTFGGSKTATKAPEQPKVIDTKKVIFDYLANNADALSYYKKQHLFVTMDELTDGQIKEIYEHLKKYNKI